MFWAVQNVSDLLGTAAVFLVFSDQMTSALVGLLLFNMTMPVTLTALYDRFPGYPAASFGLLTFALYIGVLPVFAGVVSGNIISPRLCGINDALADTTGCRSFSTVWNEKERGRRMTGII